MPHRSYLYVPGNRVELIAKAAAVADAVIVDLEDAVPQADKARARALTREALAAGRLESPVYVRLNPGRTALDDVAALHGCRLEGVRLAKAEDAGLIADLDKALAAVEASTAGAPAPIVISPIIESIAGLFAMEAIAAASPRVRSFAFGASDFVMDVRGERTAGRMETLFARSHLVAHSRRLGLEPPVAHVYTPIGDLDGLRVACDEDRALGFFGRSCIHPRQVPTINEAFAFSADRIAHARAVIAAYDTSAAQGRGAFVMADGTFIDEAHVRDARQILARAGTD